MEIFIYIILICPTNKYKYKVFPTETNSTALISGFKISNYIWVFVIGMGAFALLQVRDNSIRYFLYMSIYSSYLIKSLHIKGAYRNSVKNGI